MPIIELATAFVEGAKIGDSLGNLLYGDSESFKKAVNLFSSIDDNDPAKESKLHRVIDLLSEFGSDDKSYLWAGACLFKAFAYYYLYQFRRTREEIETLLNIPITWITIEKDYIRDSQNTAREFLSLCLFIENLSQKKRYNEKESDICSKVCAILVKYLADLHSFTGDVYSLRQLGAYSNQIPLLFTAIEEEFGVDLDDTHFLGLSREALRKNGDLEFKDVLIMDLVKEIKKTLFPTRFLFWKIRSKYCRLRSSSV